MKTNLKKIKGSMSIEILVAVTIITIAVLAATAVANKSVSIARQSTHYSQASFLLEEGAEAMRVIRDNSWTVVTDKDVASTYYLLFSSGTWSLVTDRGSATSTGAFTRSVNFSYVNRDSTTGDIVSVGNSVPPGAYLDSGTRFITITLSWAEGSSTKTKTLSFYLTNLF